MKEINFLALLYFPVLVFGQKQDNTWVIGHDYNFDDNNYGRIVLKFTTSPPQIEYPIGDVNMNMYITNTSISDSAGNLIFYSNGCNVANEYGQVIPNGDDINPGVYHNSLCDEIGRGYTAGYPSAIILPLPQNDSIYFMFHESVSYVPPPHEDAYVDRFLYSVIKVIGNKKIVLQKNTPIIVDSLATGEINAVKHANGKDWWIIVPRRNSNQFYVLLFTEEGIVDTLTQAIGDIPQLIDEGYGQTTFSPLGEKMIRYYPTNKVWVYDFDRSSGIFTGYSTIDLNTGTTIAFDGGCAISPNGRFLYIATATNVYQFDLQAFDISSTQNTVATWDGFVDPVAVLFWHCQLGPDCKIYINGGGDTRYYHIIHNPDEPGLACNVEQRGLVFSIPSGASIPYFPNYRLGPIDNPGLPCSPIVATYQPVLPLPAAQAWPNPTHDQLNFSFVNNGIKSITLTNTVGNKVKVVNLSNNSETYTMPVIDLDAGLYFWEMESSDGRSVVGKVIIY